MLGLDLADPIQNKASYGAYKSEHQTQENCIKILICCIIFCTIKIDINCTETACAIGDQRIAIYSLAKFWHKFASTEYLKAAQNNYSPFCVKWIC